MLNHMNSCHNLIIIKKIIGTICSSSVQAEKTLWEISWVQIFEHWSLLMRTCKICLYLCLHPFTKVLLTILLLITLSRKNNLLFLMNKLNYNNTNENIDNWQQTSNHPDVKLVDIDDINCMPFLIMSYYFHCQFSLVDWMNSK